MHVGLSFVPFFCVFCPHPKTNRRPQVSCLLCLCIKSVSVQRWKKYHSY